MIREAVQLDPLGHLIHRATLPSPRYIAALFNSKNKHREAAKKRRKRNMCQMKEWNKTPEKALNKMETAI